MKARLLPHVFKKIGLSILLLTFFVAIAVKLLNIAAITKIVSTNKILLSQIERSVFFTGVLLILLAKEKVEDEFIDFCRLTAFRFTFIFGLVGLILNPIPFMNINNLDNSNHLVLIQCIFYLIIFYATKKGLFRYGK